MTRLEVLGNELQRLQTELVQTQSQIMEIQELIAEEIVAQTPERGHSGDGSDPTS